MFGIQDDYLFLVWKPAIHGALEGLLAVHFVWGGFSKVSSIVRRSCRLFYKFVMSFLWAGGNLYLLRSIYRQEGIIPYNVS